MKGVVWRSLVDDEPALLLSYCLTHPLRGWGIVDGCRTETADRVARYKTDEHEEPLAMLLVPQIAAVPWRKLGAAVCLSFALILSLPLFICSGGFY